MMSEQNEQNVAEQAVSQQQPIEQEACSVCHEECPKPVELHHHENECAANLLANPPTELPVQLTTEPAVESQPLPGGGTGFQPVNTPDPRPKDPTPHLYPRREITSHKVNPANDRLRITVLDGPGAGGASHLYDIDGYDSASNPSDPFTARYGHPADRSTVLFQNGPIGEVGVNGVTHEALLAILIDRLESFQSGPFACFENERALVYLRAGFDFLRMRTHRRTLAGTEGTHKGT